MVTLMNELLTEDKYKKSNKDLDVNLFLFHSTNLKSFNEIMEAKEPRITLIENDKYPKDKKVFFAFYGLSSYKYEKNSLPEWTPICLVLNPINDFSEVFPFDSGAYSSERYKNYINELKLESFKLENHYDIINKVIYTFFDDENGYIQSKVSNGFNPDTSNIHCMQLKKLYNSIDNESDVRKCTFEIIFEKEITLKDNLKAIIAPYSLKSSNRLIDNMKKIWKVSTTDGIIDDKRFIWYNEQELRIDNKDAFGLIKQKAVQFERGIRE